MNDFDKFSVRMMRIFCRILCLFLKLNYPWFEGSSDTLSQWESFKWWNIHEDCWTFKHKTAGKRWLFFGVVGTDIQGSFFNAPSQWEGFNVMFCLIGWAHPQKDPQHLVKYSIELKGHHNLYCYLGTHFMNFYEHLIIILWKFHFL